MATFNFPFHKVRTQYPNAGDSVQFGNSYEFTSGPRAPQQRTFILNFAAMKYYHDANGNVVNNVNTTTNYKTFQEFYETHGTWTSFTYPHPIHGNLTVRFAAPLTDPEGIEGGMGVTKPFEIQLKEQP